MHTQNIIQILIAFVAAELPMFGLVLHMNSRIVKLETTIELLITHIPKRKKDADDEN
jgi:hypothetical protein